MVRMLAGVEDGGFVICAAGGRWPSLFCCSPFLCAAFNAPKSPFFSLLSAGDKRRLLGLLGLWSGWTFVDGVGVILGCELRSAQGQRSLSKASEPDPYLPVSERLEAPHCRPEPATREGWTTLCCQDFFCKCSASNANCGHVYAYFMGSKEILQSGRRQFIAEKR